MYQISFEYLKEMQSLGVNLHSDIEFSFENYIHSLESLVSIGAGCVIRDCVIDVYTSFGSNCKVFNTFVGRYCTFGNDVNMGYGDHALGDLSTSPAIAGPAEFNGIKRVVLFLSF